ncbi:RICIN domain-containing protein [Streptomyces sp. NPDC050263]|uniref:RICIN domain-containing protein n=1 Tax=Streptomyces sp. NPDC050263 TaxID=3155037 RepID=UPI003414D90E
MLDMKRPDVVRAADVQAPTRTAGLGLSSRRRWTGALAVTLSLGFAFMNANTASAAGGIYVKTDILRNWETGRCLDSNSVGQVYTNPCDQGNDYQRWTVVYKGHSAFDEVQIVNKATQRCLYSNDYPSLVLATVPCEGVGAGQTPGAGQVWGADGSGWDNVQLKKRQWCLDSNRGGSAYMQDCNGGNYQHWKLGF